MSFSVFSFLRGCAVLGLLILNTCIYTVPLFILTFFKVVLPFKPSRDFFSMLITVVAASWIRNNNRIFLAFLPTRFVVDQEGELSTKGWYLVLCNHQSWVDILTLQKVLAAKAPFLKFFIKQELIWVPILGLAWWALDFPFMKRYSRAYLEKHPEKKGKDFEATKKACEKFQTRPVSVMNFAEGTRFSPAKKERQQSPHKNLLRPKAAGSALVLATMGDIIQHIVDVTIAYPEGAPTFWRFVSGKVPLVRVHIRVLAIDEALKGDYFNDPVYREVFQKKINELWEEKDERLTTMLQKSPVDWQEAMASKSLNDRNERQENAD